MNYLKKKIQLKNYCFSEVMDTYPKVSRFSTTKRWPWKKLYVVSEIKNSKIFL